MSNEVKKETEENVENTASVEQQSNPKPSAEVAAEDSKGVAVAQEKEQPAAPQQDQSSEDNQQNAGEMDFGAMLAQFEQEQVAFHTGETVKGKVVRVSDQGALVDFGYKSEGVVPLNEFTSPEGELMVKQGDDVEVVIRHMGGDGPPTLSYMDARSRRAWDEVEKNFNEESIVKGQITAKTKGGLKVNLGGVEAFLPGSQIDSRPVRNLGALIGTEIEAKVVKFSRKRNNIVLSRKVITDEIVNKQKAETLSKIEVGYVVDGTVKNLTEYGAFVDIGGIDGLLHVTDMSWGRLHRPGDKFSVGEELQVKVLKLDREKEKVSLGFKQLLPDPWSTVTELYPVEMRVKGKVSSVTEYGAFVELEPGVEGLVHISEMSWAKRLKHPKHFVNKGDEVEVQVLGIDPHERRISLGIKQLQSNPWDTIGIRYQVGSKVKGKVRNLTDFGAFVEIEDGIDGLVHVSDISWSKKVKHPKDVLKKGQEVEAVITNLDVEGRRLSLSIKELTPSAWETFTNEHKPGDIVKGKISRFAGFGIFVELAPDLEGLCHISELSDERVENAEDLFEVGQEVDFRILRIEHDVEKIGLSARTTASDIEPVSDSKSYSSEAKGGMASLGELANLNFGGKKETADEKETAATDKAEKAPKVEKTAGDEKSEADDKSPIDSKTAEPDGDVKEEKKSSEKANEEKSAEKAADGEDKKEEPKVEEAKETSTETSKEKATEAKEKEPKEEEPKKEKVASSEKVDSKAKEEPPKEEEKTAASKKDEKEASDEKTEASKTKKKATKKPTKAADKTEAKDAEKAKAPAKKTAAAKKKTATASKEAKTEAEEEKTEKAKKKKADS